MHSEPIFDFYFEPGDFALMVGVTDELEDIKIRVRILGETTLMGQKFYVVAGIEKEMTAIGYTVSPELFIQYNVPAGWVMDIADPDELEMCPRNWHLQLI